MTNKAIKARHKLIRKIRDELMKAVSVQLQDNSIQDVSLAVGRTLIETLKIAGLTDMQASNQINEIAQMVRDRAYK